MPQPPPLSLVAEGGAMLSALAADFGRVPGASVDVMRDVRRRDIELPGCAIREVRSAAEEQEAIERLATAADWTIIVAPEFDGHLHARCLAVERAGGRLLGPDAGFVALASDKHATAEHLAQRGVRVPPGVALAAGEPLPIDFHDPAVLKPRDGAGSLGMRLITGPRADRTPPDRPARLEKYCPGTAASVAVACGPRGVVPLAPCRQAIDAARGFEYRGGSLPLPPALARRAARLARQAVIALGASRGYLGVDLVLGADASGALDTVIEINPRFTTSYVGLRALACGNLAESILAVAEGREVELCWQSGPIQFEAAGGVRRAVGWSGL